MRQWGYLGLGMFFLVIFSGCGGGGGGGGGGNVVRPPIVSAPTAGEIRETISDIGSAATGLIMTDMITTPRSPVFPNDRGETFCSGASCEPEPAHTEPYYSAEELSAIATNATIRVGERQYGVNHGEVSGQTSYRDPNYPEEENFSVDYTVYGGWLSQNFFGVEQNRWHGRVSRGSVEGLETLIAFSSGVESGSNPLMGSAEWNGLVMALDRTAPTRPVNGQAALTFDFADQTLDVQFSDIRGSRTYADMSWNDLAVVSGRFDNGDGSNSISGSFYGDTHERWRL